MTDPSPAPAVKPAPAPWEGVALVFAEMVLLLAMSIAFGVANVQFSLGDGAAIYFVFGGELLLAAPLLAWMYVRGFAWQTTLNLRPASWKLIGLGALIGLLAWSPVSTITLPFEWLLTKIGPSPELPPPATPLQALVLGLSVILVAPLVEELIFRGFVLRGWAGLGAVWAVAVSGVLFAILHGQLAALAGLVLVGVLLGSLSLSAGSVAPAMAMHAVFNLVGFIFVLFEEKLAWFSDWYYLASCILTLPLLLGTVLLFYRVANPRPVEPAPWPGSKGISLIVVSLMLVIGMFTIFGIVDVMARLLNTTTGGL